MKCEVCHSICEIFNHHFYTGLAHNFRLGKAIDEEWTYYAPLYHQTLNRGKDLIPFCTPECATEYTNVDISFRHKETDQGN